MQQCKYNAQTKTKTKRRGKENGWRVFSLFPPSPRSALFFIPTELTRLIKRKRQKEWRDSLEVWGEKMRLGAVPGVH